MSLTSASTDAAVRASFDDNASYEEDGSVSKCKAFITACRILIRREPSNVQKDGEAVSLNDLREMLTEAKAWLAGQNPTDPDAVGAKGAVSRFADLRDFR